MKRIFYVVATVSLFSWACIALSNPADSPATREDVQKYLQIARPRDMMKKMGAAMAQAMQQSIHQEYLQNQDKLPADYESRMTAMINDMFTNMPWDEMMQAMIPVYQKHFSHNDFNNLITFYSSPTGQKMVRELPAITAESIQAMMPIMNKYMETVQQKLLQKTDAMMTQSKTTQPSTPTTQK